MKRIGIIPTIRKKYSGHIESCIDLRLYSFLTFLFPKNKIEILDKKKKIHLDIIISIGGNDLYKFKKNTENKIRHSLDEFYIKYAIKNKIKFLGICYGAQSIAQFYKSQIIKKNHVIKKGHIIKLTKNNETFRVNSYHNYVIKKINNNHLENLGYSKIDNTIEIFKHQNYKILGIMWHPERYKKFRNVDKKILLNFL